MMCAADYRLKTNASFAASNDSPVNANKRDHEEAATMWLRLAELADWQEPMRLEGHLPD